jgi:hypothetical protein
VTNDWELVTGDSFRPSTVFVLNAAVIFLHKEAARGTELRFGEVRIPLRSAMIVNDTRFSRGCQFWKSG